MDNMRRAVAEQRVGLPYVAADGYTVQRDACAVLGSSVPEVHVGTSALAAALEALDVELAVLGERLTPVLLPASPPSADKASSLSAQAQTELGERLAQAAATVRRQTAYVQDLVSRLGI